MYCMTYGGYWEDGLTSERFACLRLPVFVSSVLFCVSTAVLLEGVCFCVLTKCWRSVGVQWRGRAVRFETPDVASSEGEDLWWRQDINRLSRWIQLPVVGEIIQTAFSFVGGSLVSFRHIWETCRKEETGSWYYSLLPIGTKQNGGAVWETLCILRCAVPRSAADETRECVRKAK
jgi:hypothetical protein